MIKDFFKNSIIYTLGTVLTRGIGIILIPIYTRYLSPVEYGVLDLFSIVGSIIGLTIALEITQAVARYYQEANSIKEKIQYTSTAFWFSFGVYIIYVLISIFFANTLTLLLLDSLEYKNIFILATISIATNGIFYFVQNQLKWQIQPRDNVVVSMTNILIVAAVAIFLLVGMRLKIESIFIGQICGNVFASILAIFLSKGNYKFSFKFDKLKKMLSFSFPLVLSGVAVFVAMYIDRIAIKDLMGLKELGIYGIAYRFASVASLVMMGFQSSLTPLIYKHYREKQTPEEISKIFNMFCLFALIVLACSIVFSKEILILFTTELFYEANNLIAPLILATFFSNMYIFSPGLAISKKTGIIAGISIFSAFSNTMLNYTLIPVIGVFGAAFSTLITAIATFIVYIIFGNRYYFILYKTKQLILAFLLVLTSGYTVMYAFDSASFISLMLKVLYVICITIILIYILGKNIVGGLRSVRN